MSTLNRPCSKKTRALIRAKVFEQFKNDMSESTKRK